ncbi:DUF6502 family protein [Thiosulfativibrio zosterae]|uniref:Uncharacterized protein n=1 Tax=Thiosulfativibrio zosterae TaxID=2675053 RepID=A0A6F8PPC9_9GAMM|nr:DUF6502 family protein [Thiosulfativibrio zosterae]BBP43850.1 hypothetical protein THMIRHAT_15960 [Thiosulfativibrio zosterae]
MPIEEELSLKDKALTKALKTMLKPLVRLLIQQNITFIGLQNLLKRTFVEVADESFCLENKKQTDSRVSLLTGIHRADVKRIRNEDPTQLSEKEIKASLSAQIISVWTGNTQYLDEQNRPKPLLRTSQANANQKSFEELVLSISKDKHPRSIVDDWLNQGIIELKTEGETEWVLLTEKGYVPEADFEEKLFFAGKNIGEHLHVVASNLEGQAAPLFDRAVYYEGLSAEAILELETLAKQKILQVMVEVNQRANLLQSQQKGMPEPCQSFHFGAYFSKTTPISQTQTEEKS